MLKCLYLFELIDINKEFQRLNKEKSRLESEIKRVNDKVSNEKFVSKAPKKIVEGEREKGKKYKEMLSAVITRLESLK